MEAETLIAAVRHRHVHTNRDNYERVLSPSFSGGSNVASYNSPINTGVRREWYNGARESGDLEDDDLSENTESE